MTGPNTRRDETGKRQFTLEPEYQCRLRSPGTNRGAHFSTKVPAWKINKWPWLDGCGCVVMKHKENAAKARSSWQVY